MRGIIGLVFWSAIGLVPVASALLIWSLKRRRDRLIALPPVTALLGFLVGGVAGWTSTLPAQWSASFWTTVEAAGNSAKYGESFEHTAERALMLPLTPPSSARSCSDSPRCSFCGRSQCLRLRGLFADVFAATRRARSHHRSTGQSRRGRHPPLACHCGGHSAVRHEGALIHPKLRLDKPTNALFSRQSSLRKGNTDVETDGRHAEAAIPSPVHGRILPLVSGSCGLFQAV